MVLLLAAQFQIDATIQGKYYLMSHILALAHLLHTPCAEIGTTPVSFAPQELSS
jgi:hypothetical protein